MNSIKDKIILVTGANRGIGKAIVEKFIEQGSAKIYVAARDLGSLDPLIKKYGDHVTAILLDLNQPETINAAAKIANDVEILVNNAGILIGASALSADSISTLESEMEVNVYGLMRIAEAFAPVLKANGGGALVQLNSVASIRCFTDFATYSASKAAAYSITQALRTELAEQGTQVISVHPGPIATDMANKAGIGEKAEPAVLVPEAIIDALESKQFHIYPDSLAKQIGAAYADFATNIIEGESD